MRKNLSVMSVSITFTLILFTSGIILAGAPPGWNKNIGDTYFRENSSSIVIYSNAYGTTADVFYHTGWIRDTRPLHPAWDLHDWVEPGEKGIHKYGADYTIAENEWMQTDNPLYYAGNGYKFNGEKTMITKTWTSGEGVANKHTQTTIITINRGMELAWDCALASDYDEYSDSTVALDFSDSDYEQVGIPSAGTTTRVESDNGHIVDIYTSETNDVIYITIVEIGATVTCDITISLK